MRRLRSSIRTKLIVANLAPLVTAIGLCWVLGATIITERIFNQAQQTVNSDLNSARELLLGERARLTDIIRLASLSPELAVALHKNSAPALLSPLQVLLRHEQLSFLTVVDRYGNVLYRAANPQLAGDSRRNDKMISDALKGAVTSGVSVLPAVQAAQENPQLPDMMSIPLKSTPYARLYTSKIEARGMFLVAAAPTKNSSGETVGAVYGGILLNRSSNLVDRITRVIFQRDDTSDTSSGNATLFLDDVRIATTVLDERGQRAIGSLMSEEVYDTVTRGEKWVGRAFVLKDWNFSAYEPVRDYRGAVVGALYVGMPENPYLQIRYRFNLIFTGLLIFVTLIGVTLSAWLSSSMARPIKALEEGVRRVAAGERLADIRVDTHDEIAALADEFNVMKHQLSAREEEILSLNHTLEQKVEERTRQLEEKTRELLAAQKDLAQSERLAGIGLLASGVAHEINNPLAIIRGNAELLQMASAKQGDSQLDEHATIIRQVGRIERIVRNLLTFSRAGTKQLSTFDLSNLLDSILDQTGHQIPLEKYKIARDYLGKGIEVTGDEDQLRQVFTNLILNGLQAMDGSGVLTVGAALVENGNQVSVSVVDSGPGISPEYREKLFTPFFSTKTGGTGLGLAISYGIVKDHGGEIRVVSEVGEGACFTVILPHDKG